MRFPSSVKKTLKSPASVGKLVASLSCRNSAGSSCSFASGHSSELSLRSSGALRAELDAPSGQQENSETGSYEGVTETRQPFPGLPVALLFWFWSPLLLGVTFYCRVLPCMFADATPTNGITDIWVHTWIFFLISCALPSYCPVHSQSIHIKTWKRRWAVRWKSLLTVRYPL